uniref:Nucleoside diphosphate kinase-like domain-containing protein n=1 Tax=Cyanistes caeruleus TaxID=156563 RepID=A0A8C0Z998_CYACU
MTSGPVVAMVRGHVHITTAVALSPSLSPPRNMVHASDSMEMAQQEISFWFQRDELVAWDSRDRDSIYGL